MKAINVGNTYEIFNDTLKVYDQLPPQNYVVRFAKNKGFFLEKYAEIDCKEEKIYGVHEEKVNKVLSSFAQFNRNLGVILSGAKGIGKSLFAKLLAVRGIEANLPLIIVDSYVPGIASYLEEIKQEVIILFDEFDKIFASDGDSPTPQDEMLTLFDGVSQGKKLFVITCNEIHKLNNYLVNRPGRFHYHFRFDYPTKEEIEEYLTDKLEEKYRSQIQEVVTFSRRVDINYDCLRAIAFELNNGTSFKDAIKDLNIVNTETEYYNVTLFYEDGKTSTSRRNAIDLFSSQQTRELHFYDGYSDWICSVSFNPSSCKYTNDLKIIVNGEDLQVERTSESEKYKDVKVDYIILEKARDKELHYCI